MKKCDIMDMLGWHLNLRRAGRFQKITSLKLDKVELTDFLSRLPSTKSGYFARSKLGGSIGNEVLRRFNVILDYSRKEITLTKNSRIDEKYLFIPQLDVSEQ